MFVFFIPIVIVLLAILKVCILERRKKGNKFKSNKLGDVTHKKRGEYQPTLPL
jgi:hypothetical protein